MSQLVLSINNLILSFERMLGDTEYKLSKAKSPVVKRSVKNTLEVLSSVIHHLKEYEKIRLNIPKPTKITL